MKESKFTLELIHSMESQLKCRAFKRPDSIFNPNARFSPEKGYDLEVMYRGCYSAIEDKLHKKLTAFSFDKVTTSQILHLLDVKKKGCNAYVIIGVRVQQIRKAYVLDIKEFTDLKEYYLDKYNRKSIPVEELGANCASLEWKGKGRWLIPESILMYRDYLGRKICQK